CRMLVRNRNREGSGIACVQEAIRLALLGNRLGSACWCRAEAWNDGRQSCQPLCLAGAQGFEPQLTDPESAVLPLDDAPIFGVYILAKRGVLVKRVCRLRPWSRAYLVAPLLRVTPRG